MEVINVKCNNTISPTKMRLKYLTCRFLSVVTCIVLINTAGAVGQSRFFSEEIRYSLHAKTSVLFSSIKGDYNKKEHVPDYKVSPAFGGYLSVAVSDHLAVEPGISLSLRGSKTKIKHVSKISTDEISTYFSERGYEQTDLYYLDVPLMVFYRLESKLSIGMGFSGSILLKSRYEQEITTTKIVNNTVSTYTESFTNKRVAEMKGTDAGFLFSIGYMLKDGLEATGNIYKGLSDIRDESREFKNTGFGLSLSYRFKQL